MTIMEAFKIMSDHFDDNEELGAYVRMLTTIPKGSLDLNGLQINYRRWLDVHSRRSLRHLQIHQIS